MRRAWRLAIASRAWLALIDWRSPRTAQTMRALQLAGVVGLERGRAVWTGGNTTLVQMGDILDRGDEEIGALALRLPQLAATR